MIRKKNEIPVSFDKESAVQWFRLQTRQMPSLSPLLPIPGRQPNQTQYRIEHKQVHAYFMR